MALRDIFTNKDDLNHAINNLVSNTIRIPDYSAGVSLSISQESYTSLEKAQNFCENRSTTMEKINNFTYKNDYTGYKYQIVETNVV